MSNRDELKIDVEQEIEKKDELVTPPPQQRADNIAAAGNASNEEKDKNNDQSVIEDLIKIKTLYKAALKDDWKKAYEEVFNKDPVKNAKYLTARISEKGDTALHIAAAAGSPCFIYVLQMYMRKEDLGIKNDEDNTALYLAAKHGRFKCAKQMLDIKKELLWIRGDANMLPIQIAAQQGHIRTVKYLYKVHDDATNTTKLSQEDCEKLLPNLICRADLIEVAWKLLKKHLNIVNINISNGRRGEETFLHALARTHMMSPELSNQIEEELIQPILNEVFYKNKRPHEKLPKQALDLLKQLLDEIDICDDWMYEVINVAVEHENVGFLSFIICEYSELMICPVKENRKIAGLIFSNAISKHWKDIFQLREGLRLSVQEQILDYKDEKGNNILHLAGKLSPPKQLDAICGVALQLQEELKWFEEVSNMVDASKAHEKNKDGKTPKALFDEEHKQLKKRAEQWMKDTANSCMIVAALIASVVFAAAFTVPGGTYEESGMPRFSNKLSFRILVFADAISLVLSVFSLVSFLAIHTARYAENDFLLELPKLLQVGLSSLLLSIAAMMVVFCTSIFIVFKVDNIWVRILLSVSAYLPVLFFYRKTRRLLFGVARAPNDIILFFKNRRE